jgi:nitric oxide reductase subunit C
MKPIIPFAALGLSFLAFSFSIYLQPAVAPQAASVGAAEGRLVWQKYNCQSCHQLYGLGGYLGPDLTNVYSAPGKGEAYIRSMLEAGVASMPVFDLPEEEASQLIAFLKAADASGAASPRDFVILPTGMIKSK